MELRMPAPSELGFSDTSSVRENLPPSRGMFLCDDPLRTPGSAKKRTNSVPPREEYDYVGSPLSLAMDSFGTTPPRRARSRSGSYGGGEEVHAIMDRPQPGHRTPSPKRRPPQSSGEPRLKAADRELFMKREQDFDTKSIATTTTDKPLRRGANTELYISKLEAKNAELTKENRNLKKELAVAKNNQRSFGTRSEDCEIAKLKRRVAYLEQFAPGSSATEVDVGFEDRPYASSSREERAARAEQRERLNRPPEKEDKFSHVKPRVYDPKPKREESPVKKAPKKPAPKRRSSSGAGLAQQQQQHAAPAPSSSAPSAAAASGPPRSPPRQLHPDITTNGYTTTTLANGNVCHTTEYEVIPDGKGGYTRREIPPSEMLTTGGLNGGVSDIAPLTVSSSSSAGASQWQTSGRQIVVGGGYPVGRPQQQQHQQSEPVYIQHQHQHQHQQHQPEVSYTHVVQQPQAAEVIRDPRSYEAVLTPPEAQPVTQVTYSSATTTSSKPLEHEYMAQAQAAAKPQVASPAPAPTPAAVRTKESEVPIQHAARVIPARSTVSASQAGRMVEDEVETEVI